MSQAVKCLILLAVVALLFVTELIPLAITATAGAIACGLLGFIPAKQVFSGLSKVMQELSRWGKKFIVVLDDLSFEEFEVEYKALKSILDGGLEVKPDNVLFYATSNRRNIIKEVWQDQNMNELHSRDSINEKISLADRFGIKLFFDSMDQEQYFRLLENKAEAEGLDIPKEDLRAAAVKWEMSHTGRNGRIARQLLDYLHGRS